jgi:hypothetical protein
VRIRDAPRHLTSQGVYNGGKRPFGVDIVSDGDAEAIAAGSMVVTTATGIAA